MQSEISADQVRVLLSEQFPHWSHLPIAALEGGWDNRSFRLGEDLLVRLPSAERYSAQVEKEQLWLPRLAPHLPCAIPQPVAKGKPAPDFPWNWSIYRWLEGETPSGPGMAGNVKFALDLAAFLHVLHRIGTKGAPPAGNHNFHRGGSLTVYDAETRQSMRLLSDVIGDRDAAGIWEAALSSEWTMPPVWVHGDMAVGNLLVRDGALRAVIDFGNCAIGDPACDLVMAWTFFDEHARQAFRDAMALDAPTWTRARGWALWKSLITCAEHRRADAGGSAEARAVLETVLKVRLA